MSKPMTDMPREIWASATSLDDRGLKNAFGEWIGGSEPSDPFNTRYILASGESAKPDLDAVREALEDLEIEAAHEKQEGGKPILLGILDRIYRAIGDRK